MQPVRGPDPETAFIDLSVGGFFGDIVGTLAGTLEEVFGLDDSSAFISVAGDAIALRLKALYESELGELPKDAEVIGRVLVDVMRRVGGDFRIESVEKDRIVFVNRRCPFGSRVEGRPSLCMITTNLFGRIAAETNGYAGVQVEQAIARGAPKCRVVVALERVADGSWYEFFE
ncbi:methanogen output domain 1-containing protein [Puniceibacterium sediminis]|uniref:Metanogen output domain-containing protein n=1 Tax=Puniceibacterium sediminis TaxID=1608407 RepID=A0A238UW07_9RHOB|nr:methanogen output domain 1-containing protein [Puniceibacterium sediminis]SNR26178.1 hypothetical protein SAMN06265370_101200 [Puniceibacterium sediminis]